VTVGTGHGREVTNINRVLEGLDWQRGHLRATFLLL
jgi:hypothetical protein